MFPPTQLDLVSRHLFSIELGFYASEPYLDRHGHPLTMTELLNHRLLGFDRDQQFVSGAQQLGFAIDNEDFIFRCDFMPMHIAMAINHGGILVTHKRLAIARNLKGIKVDIEIPSLPVYLVCHRDVQHNKAIRVMMDFLAQHLPHALKIEEKTVS